MPDVILSHLMEYPHGGIKSKPLLAYAFHQFRYLHTHDYCENCIEIQIRFADASCV